ncbi:MAG: hypothetical protein POELPBGB_01758 [Bacteroidia bacterium]|nr:hypothetical protein [Bacteroidia bacterium]
MRLLPLFFLFLVLASCKKDDEPQKTLSICVVEQDLYRSDSISWELYTADEVWEHVKFMEFGAEQMLFRQIEQGNLKAELYDWDLSIMNSLNINKNRYSFLDAYDYFLVFTEVPVTDTTECCAKVSIHKGRPYNKNSTAIADYIECASIGQYDSLSNTPIYNIGRACKVAAAKAARSAVNGGLMQ